MKKSTINQWIFTIALVLLAFGCAEDDAPAPVTASFQFAVDQAEFLKLNFTNFSANADTYSWNFGDGSTASTDKDPSHTYSTIGKFSVSLTATGPGGTSTKTEEITITDPNQALTLLAGLTFKTWKLFREGNALALGPNADAPDQYFKMANSEGKRPCLFTQTFTFHRDGKYVFDDMDIFWGENDPWLGTANHEKCFEPTAANMKNKDGADVSAWGSGTHAYTYNATTKEVTLNGLGAWLGFVHIIGDNNYSNVPTTSRIFKIEIEEKTGYDVLTVIYAYSDLYWTAKYVSYSNPALEPEIVESAPPFGENLVDITPSAMSHTFESANSFVELASIAGGSIITVGVDDPSNAANKKVGKFERVAGNLYQEAQIRVGGAASPDWKDVNFSSLTQVSMDVYLPSTNTYGDLTKKVIIGLADQSATEQWWTGLIQYESAELATDQWVTVTFQLNAPTYSSADGQKPFDRNDLDMVFINIGSGGHAVGGTFFIRDLKFE